MKSFLLLSGFCALGLLAVQVHFQKVNAQTANGNEAIGDEVIVSESGSALGGVGKLQATNSQDLQQTSFPVENFQEYTSPFGYRPSRSGSGRSEFHTGLDMAAPEGSYIRSWQAGRVIRVKTDAICGTSVRIQSGDWTHTYCHMKGQAISGHGGNYLSDRDGGLQIREGQTVATGARIGRVGMTGRTTGPHLHWEVRYGEEWVNPSLILQAMYQQQSKPVSSRLVK